MRIVATTKKALRLPGKRGIINFLGEKSFRVSEGGWEGKSALAVIPQSSGKINGTTLEENVMKVLNLYFSATGNTEKVAKKIDETVRELGYPVDTVKIGSKEVPPDILAYDFIFVGSGVYGQLPGKGLMDLHRELLQKYVQAGEIKPASPKRPSSYVVAYCTYGGVHTGINEAIPAVKYMGQLFDHLGFTIVGEWYVVGEYKTKKLQSHSVGGRLGDIRGRPNQTDLEEVAEKVKGVLLV